MARLPYLIKNNAFPVGFDRATGQRGRGPQASSNPLPGTPSEPHQINLTWANNDFYIEELSDSPTIESAEQMTCTHRFRIPANAVDYYAYFYHRGAIRNDSYGNLWRILSVQFQQERGGLNGTATMTIVEEAMGIDVPPDEFEVTPVELGIHIIKHPRYLYAFLGKDGENELVNQMVIRRLQDYFDNTNAAHRDSLIWLLKNSLGSENPGGAQPPSYVGNGESVGAGAWKPKGLKLQGTDMAKRAALEIIQKYWRNEETPSIVGWRVVWTRYSFTSQPLNPGGYIENPLEAKPEPLPEYFWSMYPWGHQFYGDKRYTIFRNLAYYCPQSYEKPTDKPPDDPLKRVTSISFRRLPDQQSFKRTVFGITSSWEGSPYGFWDYHLYTDKPRPSKPEDFAEMA